uniref:Protein GDAP2 homolog n=3 Tax=Hirondellea gigas TaxID=1518452 RepID=A0A2P2IDN7_9CRUS
MDASLAPDERVLDIWQLKCWMEQEEETEGVKELYEGKPLHATPPYPINDAINSKICLWSGDISLLKVGALVHCTNEAFSDNLQATQRLYSRAGPELRKNLLDNIKSCNTGEVEVSSGYNLSARYVIHAVPPLHTTRFHTAAQSSLYYCYRRVLESCQERCIASLALPVLSSPHYPYPTEDGAHIALRTLRWFLSNSSGSRTLKRVVLVLDTDHIATYTALLPLYFPRTLRHLQAAVHNLPCDLGNACGEPVNPERQIRIIDNPQHSLPEGGDVGAGGGTVETTINMGEHAFSRMEEDVDRQRLLGGQPAYVADPATAALTTDMQKIQRYERLLRRSKTEDLREISGIGCLYQCGHDKLGRPIIVFIGKWFKYNEINLDKAMLYLIQILEPVSRSDYIIIYFHTLTSTDNHPALHWIRQVYDVLDYKFKKHLKAFHIVHPTLWTKIMTWWFTTFMAPQIKHKVFSITGIEYLYETIDPDQLEVPAYITEHDMTVNGVRYYKGCS